MMRVTQGNMDELPEQYLHYVMQYLEGIHNHSYDFSKPILKPNFAKTYPVIVVFYAALILLSVLANLAMSWHIVRYNMHAEQPTYALLVNIAVANIVHVGLALPITLTVMLMVNWVFGQFVCFSLPMLQDSPTHIIMMTYLLIAVDRYRFLKDPRKPRIPAFVCAISSWFFAVCIVLPYLIYTTFLDLQDLGDTEEIKRANQGHQMCVANLADDIKEYVRSLLIGTYIAPLAITTWIYIRSSQELEAHRDSLEVAVFETRVKGSINGSRQDSNASNDVALTFHSKRWSENVGTSEPVGLSNLSVSYDADDIVLDTLKEARTQQYLIYMNSIFGACNFPLMLLRVARAALNETYENSHHYDILYVIIVWLAFLPALLTPCLYFSWQMSSVGRPMKERLLDYFRRTYRRGPRRPSTSQSTRRLSVRGSGSTPANGNSNGDVLQEAGPQVPNSSYTSGLLL